MIIFSGETIHIMNHKYISLTNNISKFYHFSGGGRGKCFKNLIVFPPFKICYYITKENLKLYYVM